MAASDSWFQEVSGPLIAVTTATIGGLWAVGKFVWRAVERKVQEVYAAHERHVTDTASRFEKLDDELADVRDASAQFRETMIAQIGERPTRKEIADQFTEMKSFIRDLFLNGKR